MNGRVRGRGTPADKTGRLSGCHRRAKADLIVDRFPQPPVLRLMHRTLARPGRQRQHDVAGSTPPGQTGENQEKTRMSALPVSSRMRRMQWIAVGLATFAIALN